MSSPVSLLSYIHSITQNEIVEANYILCDILKGMQAELYHSQARVMLLADMQRIPIVLRAGIKLLNV